jgi:hypothetical protein
MPRFSAVCEARTERESHLHAKPLSGWKTECVHQKFTLL